LTFVSRCGLLALSATTKPGAARDCPLPKALCDGTEPGIGTFTLRHQRTIQAVAVSVVLAGGVAVGWLVGGGGESVQAAEPVEFTPPTEINDAAFTPPTDIAGQVTIRSGEFGGSGSNYVCSRELLVSALTARPDRMQAWARVETIAPTQDAVAGYIRGLHPATLLKPTRVTAYKYVNGKAVPSQAILAGGTAVLTDDEGAIRVRCRTGSPLLDPILSSDEKCKSCPANYKPENAWQLSSTYYAIHPSPPPAGPGAKPLPPSKPVTITVEKQLPPQYIVKRDTRTVTIHDPAQPAPPAKIKTVTVTRTRTVPVVKTKTKTVTVNTTHTVTVQGAPRTVTVTVPHTVTVYEGSG